MNKRSLKERFRVCFLIHSTGVMMNQIANKNFEQGFESFRFLFMDNQT